MARPTHDEVAEIAQLRREGDLGSYIRSLAGLKVKARPEYQAIQCPLCGAPPNQSCTGLRGKRLGAGVHEARIGAISPQEVTSMGGAWPVGLPMERENDEVNLNNEQAVRAAALQAAAVTVASINGDENDVILLAEEYAAYIRGGPASFQRNPDEEFSKPSEAWAEPDPASMAQEFATSGYNARTKEDFGKVWKAASDAGVMGTVVILSDGEQQELGAYLTVMAAKFKDPNQVSDPNRSSERERARQTIRSDMGL